MAIPSGFWASPTRIEVKVLLFAALFLVACVEFSSQDEVTDVEGEISTSFMFNPFFFLLQLWMFWDKKTFTVNFTIRFKIWFD